MYCRAIACDYDGTGATDGRLDPEVAAGLHAARAAGIVTLLVTGRVLDDLRMALVEFSAFDAVVAENGALVWLPETDRTIVFGTPPSDQFFGRLRAASVPFHAGAVIVGTWEAHVPELYAVVRETGADLQLVFNRTAVMLLPSGINKAVGARRALEELGRSPRNLVAFGDAENDLPLFALAEIAVAARGSIPGVAAVADERLRLPGAAGVADFVRGLLERGGRMPTPRRRAIEIGTADDGRPAVIPPDGDNVLVSGDPASGKSWVAGLAAERLMEAGYRVCVFDPESEHGALGCRPGAIVLGGAIGLPVADDVGTVIHDVGASVVLDLASLPRAERPRYVRRALHGIAAERARSGVPHWTVVDEAHCVFHSGSARGDDGVVRTGNLVLVTHRPSLLATPVLESVGTFIVTRTTIEQQRYFVDGLLRTRGPAGLDVPGALRALEFPRGGLLSRDGGQPRWQTFVPRSRLCADTLGTRPYTDVAVPPEMAFAFRVPDDGVVATARTLEEFDRALASVPIASLNHHIARGDFSRWARDVLGHTRLAAGLAKLEATRATGAPIDREELHQQVTACYTASKAGSTTAATPEHHAECFQVTSE